MVNIDVEMDNCESSGDESSAHQQSSSGGINPESITMDQMNRPSSGWYGLVDDEYSSEDNDSDDASLCYSSDGEASLASSDSSDESLVGLSIENGCILSDHDDDCEVEREDSDRSATGDNEIDDYTVPTTVQQLHAVEWEEHSPPSVELVPSTQDVDNSTRIVEAQESDGSQPNGNGKRRRSRRKAPVKVHMTRARTASLEKKTRSGRRY